MKIKRVKAKHTRSLFLSAHFFFARIWNRLYYIAMLAFEVELQMECNVCNRKRKLGLIFTLYLYILIFITFAS